MATYLPARLLRFLKSRLYPDTSKKTQYSFLTSHGFTQTPQDGDVHCASECSAASRQSNSMTCRDCIFGGEPRDVIRDAREILRRETRARPRQTLEKLEVRHSKSRLYLDTSKTAPYSFCNFTCFYPDTTKKGFVPLPRTCGTLKISRCSYHYHHARVGL